MVAEARSKTIRVTPEMRLVQDLDEAAATPVYLENDGTLFRLSRETETTVESERQEELAAIERIIARRKAAFGGNALPDDSTDILRRQREERSRYLADL